MQHQQHHMHFQTATSPSSLHSPSSATVLPHTTATALYSHVTHMPTSQPLHHYHPHQQTPSTHPHGIAQSHHAMTGVTSQHQPSPDPWIGRNKGPTPTYPIGPPRGLAGPPASLAEQLKQVLAERERRISGDQASSREGSGDFTEMNKGVSQTLAEEIRQAVNEANARGKLHCVIMKPYRYCLQEVVSCLEYIIGILVRNISTMAYLRQLVTGFALLQPRFSLRSGHCGIYGELRQVFS